LEAVVGANEALVVWPWPGIREYIQPGHHGQPSGARVMMFSGYQALEDTIGQGKRRDNGRCDIGPRQAIDMIGFVAHLTQQGQAVGIAFASPACKMGPQSTVIVHVLARFKIEIIPGVVAGVAVGRKIGSAHGRTEKWLGFRRSRRLSLQIVSQRKEALPIKRHGCLGVGRNPLPTRSSPKFLPVWR
jgi:hypothetical protein